jgi:hypothetical protein
MSNDSLPPTAFTPRNMIGHLTNKKIGHLYNAKIPQMADASGGFLLYNWVQITLKGGRARK